MKDRATIQNIHKSTPKSTIDNNVISTRKTEDLTDKISKPVDKKSITDSDSNTILKTVNHTNRSSNTKNFSDKVIESSPTTTPSSKIPSKDTIDDEIFPTSSKSDQNYEITQERNNTSDINYAVRECKSEQIQLESLLIQYEEEKAARFD